MPSDTPNVPVILIVEDELIRRDEFKHRLGSSAIITFADDPMQAIKLIRTRQFDFIFLDHDMGSDMTGYDVACCLCLSCNRMTPVMIHSANSAGATRIGMALTDQGIRYMCNSYYSDEFWEDTASFLQGV